MHVQVVSERQEGGPQENIFESMLSELSFLAAVSIEVLGMIDTPCHSFS